MMQVQCCPCSVLFRRASCANALLIARIPNAGATGPLDCIATAAPQLQGLHASRPFGANQVGPAVLSPAASLPSSLTSLSLEGYSAGFEPHQSQLVSLWWQPMERYGRVRFPNEAIEGLSQVGARAGRWLQVPLRRAALVRASVLPSFRTAPRAHTLVRTCRRAKHCSRHVSADLLTWKRAVSSEARSACRAHLVGTAPCRPAG